MKPWETDDTFLSRWLSGELSQQELAAFEASPDYEEYVATVASTDQVEVGPYDEDQALAQLMTRIADASAPSSAKTIPFRPRWWMAAAAVVLLLAVIGTIQFLVPGASETIYAAERMAHTLPDGSVIDLRKGSTIEYSADSWAESRTVFLEGNAYFEVEKGSRFDVVLEEGQVSVLGTTFDVKEYEDSLAVTCFSGKVRVEAFEVVDTLSAKESATLSRAAAPRQTTTSLDQPQWLSPRIALNKVPLSSVIAQVRELYGIDIIGEVGTELIYTGVFPVNDLETALSQIFDPFRISYELDPSNHVVTLLP